MRIVTEGLSVRLDGVPIVSDVDLHIESGRFVGLIGPNGSGKSTLLRAVYRALRPARGTIWLGQQDLWQDLTGRAAARLVSVVAQETPSDFDFSVRDVVAAGRTPHKGLLDRDSASDRDLIELCLERVGMTAYADRRFSTLSGGEKQRVRLGRALTQQGSVLILDEPTNHLDVRSQLDLLELVRELGITTIAALHELNLAAGYCDDLYLLEAGRIVARGEVDAVLTPSRIAEVFGLRAHCGRHPLTGRLHLAFAPLATVPGPLYPV